MDILKFKKNNLLTIIGVIFFIPQFAFAIPAMFTYQGRILKADKTPLTYNSVAFEFRILAHNDDNCVLFIEQKTGVDLSLTNGVFDVSFGSNPTFLAASLSSAHDVFQNDASYTCQNTSTYSPTGTATRRLQVRFWDGESWQILNQKMDLTAVPYASHARRSQESANSLKLGGFDVAQFAMKPGASCGTGVVGFDGTSLTCVTLGAAVAPTWGDVTGKPTTFAPSPHTHVVDEITSASGKYFTYLPNNVACANNEVLKWNGTGWVCGTDNSGVGSAITALTGDVSASGTGSVAATVDSVGGKTAAQIATAVNDINNASATYLAKAGGTMSGAINMGSQNMTNTGYITMNASVTLHLSNNGAAPGGLALADKGKMWFNSASNKIEYWDGSAVKAISDGGSASDLTSITGTGIVVRNGAASYSTLGVTAPLAMVAGNLVLNNTAVTPGSYGSATQVGTFTVDAQGRLTAASNVTITPAWGSITGTPTTLSGYGITDALSSTLADGKILVGNATNVATPVTVSGDATLSNVGVITLSNSGATAGTYTKVTVDAKGRVTSVANIAASDITTALGFTPLNKAGDVMTGLLGLNGVTADPAGLTGTDKGKLWFRTDTNEVKYWNGSAAVALGVSGAGLTSLNGQTGSTQTFAIGTTGTAPAYSSASNTHTLNIPMASTAGTTAGLLSKTDYDVFNAKLGTASAFSGDVSGTSSTMSVDKIKGSPISLTAPANGQYLKYNGTNWINSALSVNLAADVTGTLPVANGGTGATSLGSGNLLVGSGTGAVTSLNSGLAGNVVYSTGASSWASGTADTAGLVDKSSTQTISGAKAFTNYIQMAAQNLIRFADSDSSNYVAIRAPATVGADVTLTLPATAGSNGQVLSTDGTGALSWTTPAAGGITSLNGLSAGMQTFAIGTSGTAPAFSSTTSTHTLNIPMASAASVTAGLISKTDYDNFNNKLSATITTPTTGQVIRYNGTSWVNALLDLTNGVTGTLPVANGGTGVTTIAAGSLVVGNGTSAVTGIAGGAANNVLYATGASTWASGTPTAAGLVDLGTAQTVTGSKTFQFSDNNDTVGTALTVQRMRSDSTAPTAGHGAEILYKLESDTNGTMVDAGSIATQWEASQVSAATRDSAMVFKTALDGTVAEQVRITSAGAVGIGDSAPNGKLDVKGSIVMSGATSGYTGFQPAAAAGSTVWTLPTADGSNGQVLTTNGAGILNWSTPSAGGITSLGGQMGSTQTFGIGDWGTAPTFVSSSNKHTLNIPMASTAGTIAGLLSKTDYDAFNAKLGTASTFSGDVSGTSSTMSVDKIKGSPITLTSPASGQYLTYNGTNWINSVLSVNLASEVTGALPITNGGTGATTVVAARSNLGLGSAAVLNTGVVSGNVPIVGVAGITNNRMCTSDGSGAITCSTALPSPGGGDGNIQYKSGTGFAGTSSLHWDSANFRLGVGTGVPARTLDVSVGVGGAYSSSRTTGTSPGTIHVGVPVIRSSMTNGGDNYGAYYEMKTRNAALNDQTAYIGAIASSGAAAYTPAIVIGQQTGFNAYDERMRIDAAGNVGIGITSPSAKLDVAGGVRVANGSVATPSIAFTNNPDTGLYQFNGEGVGVIADGTLAAGFTPWYAQYYTPIILPNGTASDYAIGSNSAAGLFFPNSATLAVGTNGVERLRVDSAGNVGIGTSAPGSKLDVVGDIRASGQISSASQTISGGTNSINWNNGNSILTDYDCASAISMANLRNGGSYTLVVTGTGTTQCNFSTSVTGSDAATVTYRFKPTNAARTASSYTVYTFMRVGTVVLVSWASGF